MLWPLIALGCPTIGLIWAIEPDSVLGRCLLTATVIGAVLWCAAIVTR